MLLRTQLLYNLPLIIKDMSLLVSRFTINNNIIHQLLRGHAGRKTLHQQNPPVLNWRCRLAQVDMYNGRKTGVVVVGTNETYWLAVAAA